MHRVQSAIHLGRSYVIASLAAGFGVTAPTFAATVTSPNVYSSGIAVKYVTAQESTLYGSTKVGKFTAKGSNDGIAHADGSAEPFMGTGNGGFQMIVYFDLHTGKALSKGNSLSLTRSTPSGPQTLYASGKLAGSETTIDISSLSTFDFDWDIESGNASSLLAGTNFSRLLVNLQVSNLKLTNYINTSMIGVAGIDSLVPNTVLFDNKLAAIKGQANTVAPVPLPPAVLAGGALMAGGWLIQKLRRPRTRRQLAMDAE